MHIRIEPNSSVPIYRQIMGQIREMILTGVLPPRTQLPSVRQLAQQLAVNQNTILKVYKELAHENLLVMERGVGVYVAPLEDGIRVLRAQKELENMMEDLVENAFQLGFNYTDIYQALDKEYRKWQEGKDYGSGK